MCRPVTSIYACGHIKNAWERCGGGGDDHSAEQEPVREREREPMSQTGVCENCSPWGEPTVTMYGWDMCVLRVIAARRHSWKCCECGRVNEAESPSCKGQYMFHAIGTLNIHGDRICGHPICEICLGIDSNGAIYEVDKSEWEGADEEEPMEMEMEMDIDDDAREEGSAEVEEEGNEEEGVEGEGGEEVASSEAACVAGHQFSLPFRPRVPPRD